MEGRECTADLINSIQAELKYDVAQLNELTESISTYVVDSRTIYKSKSFIDQITYNIKIFGIKKGTEITFSPLVMRYLEGRATRTKHENFALMYTRLLSHIIDCSSKLAHDAICCGILFYNKSDIYSGNHFYLSYTRNITKYGVDEGISKLFEQDNLEYIEQQVNLDKTITNKDRVIKPCETSTSGTGDGETSTSETGDSETSTSGTGDSDSETNTSETGDSETGDSDSETSSETSSETNNETNTCETNNDTNCETNGGTNNEIGNHEKNYFGADNCGVYVQDIVKKYHDIQYAVVFLIGYLIGGFTIGLQLAAAFIINNICQTAFPKLSKINVIIPYVISFIIAGNFGLVTNRYLGVFLACKLLYNKYASFGVLLTLYYMPLNYTTISLSMLLFTLTCLN